MTRAPTVQPHPEDPSSGPLDPLKDAAAAPGFWPLAAICATACLGLLIMQFGGSEQTYATFFPPSATVFDPYWVLRVKAWWVGSILIGFLALPALLMSLLPGNRLRDCNLGFRGFREHFWIYVGLYGAVLPVIWLVSLSPSFYTFYPMYGQAGRSWFDLLMWEGMYAGQFVALEFFFRGFLVGGLGRYIGIFAVPVSVMPYMMIHFTKLLPEAAASVVAGFDSRLPGVEDEVHLGRRVRPLRGGGDDGFARACAQRPAPLVARIARDRNARRIGSWISFRLVR